MNGALTIAGREFRSSFVTPVAYTVIAGFVLLSGFFFFTLVQQFNSILYQAALIPDTHASLNEWVIYPFYQTLEVILVFLIPILTMRSIAEERQRGTFELLATSPIRVSGIIFGKFLGLGAVISVMLGFAFLFPLSLMIVADPEVLPALIGFLGILLVSLSFMCVGIAVSACTSNQAVAAVVGIVVLLMLVAIDLPASKLGERSAAVLEYLSPSHHADLLFQGAIASSDVVYFFSLGLFGLFVASRVLDAQRWR